MTKEKTPKPLAKELEIYRKNISNWTDHVGEHVVIHGQEVVGFYSTYSDAVRMGYDKFGLEPFLVKQVSVIEQIHFIPPLIRVDDGTLHTSN